MSAPAVPTGKITWLDRWLVRQMLRLAGQPRLAVELWNGERLTASSARNDSTAPVGTVQIDSRRCLLRLLTDPELHFGEEWSDGHVDIEGDLTEVLCELNRSLESTARRRNHPWRWPRLRRPGSAQAARHNIHHHYDLGNDFYRLWLDEQLLYTCAYFDQPPMSLEAAQIAKMDHVCRKLRLQPGERVIEAGSGWGALALHMARRYGVTVRSYNIAHEQVVESQRLAHKAGLTSQVEFIEDDWRNITGSCDAFVSVGMLEHVRPENYPHLGRMIDGCLPRHGRGLIHTIGLNTPRPLDRWTERYIFPGAQPPALSQMTELFEPYGFSILDVENLRLHYAETLRHWLARFEQSADRIRDMFDERFVRMWRLYLAASVATFETGWLQLFQVVFARGASNDVPWTRSHLYADARRLSSTAGESQSVRSQ